jgi:D-alanyl-lipoteichoic acid acyltransferase DltB (MBOAT superfamily)
VHCKNESFSPSIIGRAGKLSAMWSRKTSAISTSFLPPVISSFTFTQISYLVDFSRDRKLRDRFFDDTLFVVLFPHFIAGRLRAIGKSWRNSSLANERPEHFQK